MFRTYLAQWLGLVLGMSALGACARNHGGTHGAAAGSGAPSDGHATPSAGHGATDAGSPHLGGAATALLEPTDAAAMSDSPPVTGLGTFTDIGTGVDLMINLRGCETKTYPVYIQQGTDCSADTLLGAHWDSPRGEGIGAIDCVRVGTSGVGRTYYSRPNSDKKPWTIGNPSASDVLDHVLVVYDPTTLQPIACGQIVRADDAALVQPSADAGVPTMIRAQIAGLCLTQMFVRDNAQECPNPDEVVKCASTHCELDACVATCHDYVACLKSDTTGEPCSAAFTCSVDEACSSCQSKITACLLGFCPELVACAAPVTPDGPCSRLEACCAMQGDAAASCLESVHAIEKFSGDPSCVGAMMNWETTAHLPVPCKFK